MTSETENFDGDKQRDAIDALGGYVYQVFQSALAWLELKEGELLFLETSEDFVSVAKSVIKATQVKRTKKKITINDDGVIKSIDSLVALQKSHPDKIVALRFLTTSEIGVEKKKTDRVSNGSVLIAWRKLAKSGDISELRTVLANSKLSDLTKEHLRSLGDSDFRNNLLKRLHFDCGQPQLKWIDQDLIEKLIFMLKARDGQASQAENCKVNILWKVLTTSILDSDRFLTLGKLEQLLEESTQITVNRKDFERQGKLINSTLSATLPVGDTEVNAPIIQFEPSNEVALPANRVARNSLVGEISSSLHSNGLCWLYGATGLGKTVLSKLTAENIGGKWGTLQLRGSHPQQCEKIIDMCVHQISEKRFDGIIIEDFNHSNDTSFFNPLRKLFSTSLRLDCLIIVTSSNRMNPTFLFDAGIASSVQVEAKSFSENEIAKLLEQLNVDPQQWKRYIYLLGGCGHPQLTAAAIQSMSARGWSLSELNSLDSFISGNEEIEQVRTSCRIRIMSEISDDSRQLLERLSLKTDGFNRDFVLNIAKKPTELPNAAIVFDSLIGIWIDQQSKDHFKISPLLSNLAVKNLTSDGQKKLQWEIADIIMRGKSIDVGELDTAFISGWSSNHHGAILKICIAILGSNLDELEMISDYFLTATSMRTDTPLFDDNPVISHLFRGVQLILYSYSGTSSERFTEILESFFIEGEDAVQAGIGMEFIILIKLLMSDGKIQPLPDFINLLERVFDFFENLTEEMSEISQLLNSARTNSQAPLLGFLFMWQIRRIDNINALLEIFDSLDSTPAKLRTEILNSLDNDEIDAEMYLHSAWLKEHDAQTIDPKVHADVFRLLEETSRKWGRIDIPIACRKFRAVILDEYGDNSKEALDVINAAIENYGSNQVLIRAKAKIFFRSKNHKESLKLSKDLISNPEINVTERAFLGRDAAISAENEADYKLAKEYYLFASNAAKATHLPDMLPMEIGLLGDAALASWHLGDKKSCLQGFYTVLDRLKQLDPTSSLRAHHCHAVFRHLLLWMTQTQSGSRLQISPHEETKIYPGCMSNPEPHPDINKQVLCHLSLCEYMLAALQDYCLCNLSTVPDSIPNCAEGLFMMGRSGMFRALRSLDTNSFFESLTEKIQFTEFSSTIKNRDDAFSMTAPKVIAFPPLFDETLQKHADIFKNHCLLFAGMVAISEQNIPLSSFFEDAIKCNKFGLDQHILRCIDGNNQSKNYIENFAVIAAKVQATNHTKEILSPNEIFEFVFKMIELSIVSVEIETIAPSLLIWFEKQLANVWAKQRFLLARTGLYERELIETLEEKNSDVLKIIAACSAFLQMLNINNSADLTGVLKEYLEKCRT